MINKYISRDQDISRLMAIIREETKAGVDKEFIICPEQYIKQNPTALTYYVHPKTINKMAEDGYLKKLDSWPFLDANIANMVGPEVYKVLVYADKIYQTAEVTYLKNTPKQLQKNKPPTNWQLSEQKKEVHLKRDGEVLFIFPNNWSQKYKYFKCLWHYYDQLVPYTDIYEFESNLKHPKDHVAKENSNIRRVFDKLRKEINNESVVIEISKGAKLTLTG